MKNYIASTLVVAGLIILVFGMDASGQGVSRVVADIPFDFYIGKDKLPGGKYEFSPASMHAPTSAMIVRPLFGNERQAMIVPAMNGEQSVTDGDFVVVFNRYGSVHYLSKVKMSSGGISLLARSSAERQIAKQLDRSGTVVVGPAIHGN